jgi:hypothetical protein
MTTRCKGYPDVYVRMGRHLGCGCVRARTPAIGADTGRVTRAGARSSPAGNSKFHDLTRVRATAPGGAVRRISLAFASIIGVARFTSVIPCRDATPRPAPSRAAHRGFPSASLAENSPSEAGPRAAATRTALPTPARMTANHVRRDRPRFSGAQARPRSRPAATLAGGGEKPFVRLWREPPAPMMRRLDRRHAGAILPCAGAAVPPTRSRHRTAGVNITAW